MLFPMALLLVTNFPKIILKNSLFLLNSHQKCSKFSEIFPTLCFLVQMREKITHVLLIFRKICIFSNFLKKIFENFAASGGWLRPPDPPFSDPKNVFPGAKIRGPPMAPPPAPCSITLNFPIFLRKMV